MTLRIILITIALLAGSCAVDDTALGESTQAQITLNAMTFNALTYNSITYNGIAYNGLNLGNGLDLANPDVHLFVEYLVSCALPAGAEVAVQGETFAGALGLAPEWAIGPCEGTCQRWVSACLLGRVNARGERVAISMRGPKPGLHPGVREIVDYPVEDGTFFGNLFATPQQLFATSPRPDLALPRTCGDAGAGCPIEVVGRSADVCATWSPALGRTSCPSAEAVTVYLQ